MTQPSADILLRIERLLDAGKQHEARLLLVEYIKLNPASARAWWLMSLTLSDLNQQIECLERVQRFDPQNEMARERLAKLKSQPPASPSAGPFSMPFPIEAEGTASDVPLPPAPAWSMHEAVQPQPVAEQPEAPATEAPVELAGEKEPAQKSKPKRGWIFVLVAVLAIASFAGYAWLQRKAKQQAQEYFLQETRAAVQVLTNLPSSTFLPTLTHSPTRTASPTATISVVPTLTLTLQYTFTRTPIPTDKVGPIVALYAPDFSLADLASGNMVTLSQFNGQPVVLFFWSTHCTPCINEISSIETIAQAYKNTDLVILTVDVGETPATVNSFLSTRKLDLPILLDLNSTVQSVYNMYSLPGNFFISSSGRIAFIRRAAMKFDEMKVQVDAIVRRYPTATP